MNTKYTIKSNVEYLDIHDESGEFICTVGIQVFPDHSSVDIIINKFKSTMTAQAMKNGREVLHQLLEGVSILAAIIEKKPAKVLDKIKPSRDTYFQGEKDGKPETTSDA